MATAVDNLQKWFTDLDDADRRSVIAFLYDGKALLREGAYVGPRPGLVNKGLHVGPTPASSSNVCSQCGRPY